MFWAVIFASHWRFSGYKRIVQIWTQFISIAANFCLFFISKVIKNFYVFSQKYFQNYDYYLLNERCDSPRVLVYQPSANSVSGVSASVHDFHPANYRCCTVSASHSSLFLPVVCTLPCYSVLWDRRGADTGPVLGTTVGDTFKLHQLVSYQW